MQTLFLHAPKLIGTLLFALFGALFYWQIAQTWFVTEEPQVSHESKAPIKQAEPESQVKSYDISAFSLFGKAGQKPAEQAVEQKDLPKTNLRLTLTGVLAATKENMASALILGPDKQTLLYKEGDTVPGNATLHKIHADRVVLSRRGKLENLFFPKVSQGGPYFASVQNESDDQLNDDDGIAEPAPIPKASTPSLAPGRKQSIKDRLKSIRQRIKAGQN